MYPCHEGLIGNVALDTRRPAIVYTVMAGTQLQWQTDNWLAGHTFTEGRGGRVQALLKGGGGVHLDRGAALGAAHQGKVDARVHRTHYLHPDNPLKPWDDPHMMTRHLTDHRGLSMSTTVCMKNSRLLSPLATLPAEIMYINLPQCWHRSRIRLSLYASLHTRLLARMVVVMLLLLLNF